MADMTESEYNLTIDEEDLTVFIRVYRSLKDTFWGRTRMVLLHVEDDIWEFRVIGLTSREWLEFCANVYAELPSETVDLVEEAVNTKNTAADFINEVGFETVEEKAEEPDEEEGEEELEEEEDPDEESADHGDETPEEEIQRKLGKPKLVRKTKSSAVTVETD